MSYFRMRRNEPWGKRSDLLCDQCGGEFYGAGVEWSFGDKDITLHPSCAQHVGMSLIGDARSAGYVSGDDSSKPVKMSSQFRRQEIIRKEAKKLAADPSLVTKPIRQDEEIPF